MFVIGTAGHVDHGKSTLVKALTGIDPDRLREEKEREMTIELGFAWLTLPSGREVSIVDVPGHERFVKNMLAGVGGIDLAMLVVAADESVMPQTREHLAILDLLCVNRGLAVLTKKDLVDDEWLELVQLELEEALQGTSMEGVSMVAVSAAAALGLDELKDALDRLLEETPPRADLGRPRLAVDRSFTMSGFGAVVTGTLLDGALSVGQVVELVPSGRRGRIRGLQSHRRRIESVGPGHRVAVNLSGVSREDVPRGEVLTVPGWLGTTRMVSVELRLTRWAPQPVRHNLGVTFHTGTSETNARVRLLDTQELKPGEHGWAQVHLERPLPLVKGDRFIIRSAQWTLGGGQVVEISQRRYRRLQPATIERLEVMAAGSPRELLLQGMGSGPPVAFDALVTRSNLSQGDVQSYLQAMVLDGAAALLGRDTVGPGSHVASAAGWLQLKEQAAGFLEAYHSRHPLRQGAAREELRGRLKLAGGVFPHVLARLAAEGALVEEGPLVRSSAHRALMSPEQERAVDLYVESLERDPFAPSTEAAIDPELLGAIVAQGRVVRVGDGVVFAARAYNEMVERIVGRLKEQGSITVADVRDLFGTTRKYALPLMEHLDQEHITRRVGDQRVLVRRE